MVQSPTPADGAPLAIRVAEPGDLPEIVAIENGAFASDRISRRSFRRLIGSSSAAVLVADAAGVVLGCSVVLFRAYSRRARLYSLAVLGSAAGQGLGARLLKAAQQAAEARGCVAMTLEVRADNARAIALYETHGFEPLGETPGYYSDGGSALHFQKVLGGAA
ncbi:MAG: GNAT family N-acetyltransferase [Mesorhizobium amorphae]|nr:MAG: GNAT family N-acetyltransferase [Mesorhizobium amorphae]